MTTKIIKDYEKDKVYKKLIKSVKKNKNRRIPANASGPYTIEYKDSIETILDELKEGKINKYLYQKILNTKRKNLVNLFSEINLRSIDEIRNEDYSKITR